jgi:hypothetical protein
MQAIIDAGTWAGRRQWLSVAGLKREAGRQKSKSRHRWAVTCRQTGDTVTQGIRYRGTMQTKVQKQDNAELCRQKWAGRQAGAVTQE